MTDKTKPISSSNPPESRGVRNPQKQESKAPAKSKVNKK